MPKPSIDKYPIGDYWPFTHMQAWNIRKYAAFLKEFSKMEGKPYNSSTKIEFMHSLTASGFYDPSRELTDDELGGKWDKYVSLIYYLGLGRTDRRRFELSEVAKHFFVEQNDINGLLKEQMLKFQYPHGSLKAKEINDLKAHGKKILPFVFIIQIMRALGKNGLEQAYISKGELLSIVEKAKSNEELPEVLSIILENRSRGTTYEFSKIPSKVLDIGRLFSFFAGTGVLEFDAEDEIRTVYIESQEQIDEIDRILSKDFRFFDFKDREEWIEYYQGLSNNSVGTSNTVLATENVDLLTDSKGGHKEMLEKMLSGSHGEDHLSSLNLLQIAPPNKIKIPNILANISEKRWLLPYFQRYFDWDKNKVKNFLESIFRGYYVGTLLLWNVSNKEPEFETMPIRGCENGNSSGRIDSIILDGQQRITSLYYAIRAPDLSLKKEVKRLYFYINFTKLLSQRRSEDIIEFHGDRFKEEDLYRQFLFPFYELENYENWTDAFEDYLNELDKERTNEIRNLMRIIRKRLSYMVNSFEIPYVSLPDSTTLTEVADIFERINTMGKPLSTFDLLIARLSKSGIKLKDLWEKTLNRHTKIKDYYKAEISGVNSVEKLPIYVIQAMLLAYGKTGECKRENQLNIYQDIFESNSRLNFEKVWNEMAGFVDKAISKLSNLRDGYGVNTLKTLPYDSTIPILAALTREIEIEQTKKASCYAKLDIWYWSVVFSDAYSQAVDTTMSSDYKEMIVWFYDDAQIPKTVREARKEFSILNLRDLRTRTNAKYKGVLAILTMNGSKDFNSGQTLENNRTNDTHHLFPKSVFKKGKIVYSVLNQCWMSPETNRKIINWKKPKVYVKEFIKEKYDGDEKKFIEILKTHLISEEAYGFLASDDFEGFINEREKTVRLKIAALLGLSATDAQEKPLITPDTPFSNELMIRRTIESCRDFLYWVDKYFSRKGLEYLADSLVKDKIRSIKILMDGTPLLIKETGKMKEDLRNDFRKFTEEMKNRGIICELRVIVDSKVRRNIHDRWIITKDNKFNLPSPDTIARGQYSEISETSSNIPFDLWWGNSLDIIQGWDEIKKIYQK